MLSSLLQKKHPFRQRFPIDAQIKVQQKAQRHFKIHKLPFRNTSYSSYPLLRPFIILERFSRHADRCEGKPVDSPVSGWDQEICDTETVAVQCSSQIHSRTMRAELVQSHEILADAERRGGLGEEASGYRDPLERCVLRVCAMFDVGRFVRLCFGRPDVRMVTEIRG